MTEQEKKELFNAFSVIEKLGIKTKDAKLRHLHIVNMDYVNQSGLMDDYYNFFFEKLKG